jgi:hypothetical protein
VGTKNVLISFLKDLSLETLLVLTQFCTKIKKTFLNIALICITEKLKLHRPQTCNFRTGTVHKPATSGPVHSNAIFDVNGGHGPVHSNIVVNGSLWSFKKRPFPKKILRKNK